MSWSMILILIALVCLLSLAIWQRKEVANFFRAIISPGWNNRVLLIIFLAFVASLCLSAHKEASNSLLLPDSFVEQTQKRKLPDYIEAFNVGVPSDDQVQLPKSQQTETASDTSFYWTLTGILFVCLLGFTPIAFNDEVRRGYYKARDGWKLRKVKIDLHPKKGEQVTKLGGPSMGSTVPTSGKQGGGFFQLFSTLGAADMANDMIKSIGGQILRRVFRR